MVKALGGFADKVNADRRGFKNNLDKLIKGIW
jgi:hypothetical protein